MNKVEMIFAMIKTEMQSDGSFLVDDISQALWENNRLEVTPEAVMRAVATLRKQGNDIVTTGNGWYRLVKTSCGTSASVIYANMQ